MAKCDVIINPADCKRHDQLRGLYVFLFASFSFALVCSVFVVAVKLKDQREYLKPNAVTKIALFLSLFCTTCVIKAGLIIFWTGHSNKGYIVLEIFSLLPWCLLSEACVRYCRAWMQLAAGFFGRALAFMPDVDESLTNSAASSALSSSSSSSSSPSLTSSSTSAPSSAPSFPAIASISQPNAATPFVLTSSLVQSCRSSFGFVGVTVTRCNFFVTVCLTIPAGLSFETDIATYQILNRVGFCLWAVNCGIIAMYFYVFGSIIVDTLANDGVLLATKVAIIARFQYMRTAMTIGWVIASLTCFIMAIFFPEINSDADTVVGLVWLIFWLVPAPPLVVLAVYTLLDKDATQRMSYSHVDKSPYIQAQRRFTNPH